MQARFPTLLYYTILLTFLPATRLAAAPSDPPRVSPSTYAVQTTGENDPRLDAARQVEAFVARYGQPAPDPRRPGGSLTPGAAGSRVVEGGGAGGSAPPALGWLPYQGPFGVAEATHLLNRATIGSRVEEIDAAAQAGLPATLDQLFAPQAAPASPGPWATEPVPNQTGWTPAQKDSLATLYRDRVKTLKAWWTQAIAEAPETLRESMTLFWHDHFATKAASVTYPQSNYLQNSLLRQYALGNFRTLTRQLCTDPAMLIFLNGNVNRKGSPNENFARELMELFTMGEGSGYTQSDVTNAARALTGWQTDGTTSFFTQSRFDATSKTILGQTGNWGVDDVIRIIFEQPATARYLSDKLYRWYLDDEPAPADVEALAQTLRAGNYEVAPVLRQILASRQFFDPQFRGGIVKDGVDIYAGQLRRFHVAGFTPQTNNNQRNFIVNQMGAYAQVLFDPPDVAGWPGHRSWINSNSLPNRKKYSVQLVDGNGGIGMQLDVIAETDRLSNPNDAEQLVDDLGRLGFGAPPTPTVRQAMLDALLQGAATYDWSMTLPDAPQRLRDLYRFTMRLPDYQLK